MALVSLQLAIAKNQKNLGVNFENLGKKNRVYLSYDKSAGWSVRKFAGLFGVVQQIFRWLGFYASTHLKTVVQQIQKEPVVNSVLKAKIYDCWKRQTGKELKPSLLRVNEPKKRFIPDLQAPNRFGSYIGDTHISVELGDITRVKGVTGIVNAANEACLGGGGVDGAIHEAAGPALRQECEQLPEIRPGVRCETGRAVITGAGLLGQGLAPGMIIQRVLHAVGPRYNPADPEGSAALLKATYISALNLAHENGVRSIAFPSIGTGIFCYPFDAATRIAMQAIEEYVLKYPDRFDEIKFVFTSDRFDSAYNVWHSYVHPGVRDHFMT